jgi:hypothetical protein
MDITVRKLERWRHCLPQRIVEHRPGMRGSHSSNPPGYVDQVIAIDTLLRSGVPLRDVPMRLFEQGFPIDLEVLRMAYADLYALVHEGLTAALPHADADAEPGDRADALALVHASGMRRSTAGRRWANRVRGLVKHGGVAEGDDPDALFVSVVSVMFTWLLAGQPPSAQGTVDALTVAGLDDGQDPEATAARLARINLDAICAAIETATETQWLAARQDLDLLAHHVELRQRVDQRWQPGGLLLNGMKDVGLDDPAVRSYVMPIALVLRETWRQNLRAEHELYQAACQLLDDLPDKFHTFLGADGEARLVEQPEDIRVELGQFLLAWSLKHLTHAAALNFEIPPTPAV